MKKYLPLVFTTMLMAGCAGPSYSPPPSGPTSKITINNTLPSVAVAYTYEKTDFCEGRSKIGRIEPTSSISTDVRAEAAVVVTFSNLLKATADYSYIYVYGCWRTFEFVPKAGHVYSFTVQHIGDQCFFDLSDGSNKVAYKIREPNQPMFDSGAWCKAK